MTSTIGSVRGAESKLVNVVLEVLHGNSVVCPIQRTLELAPKALNRC